MSDFLMPSLGADMEAGTLVEWKKAPGDRLNPGDIIAEVETQKGLIEIEVFEAGILENHLIEEGEKVPVGTPMASIRSTEISEKTSEIHPVREKEQSSEDQPTIGELSEEKTKKTSSQEKPRIKASPLARKIAEKNNIDLSSIQGTGESGAITKADVEAVMTAEKKTSQEAPARSPKTKPKKAEALSEVKKEAIPSSELINGDRQKNIRLAVASAMSRSNREIPHYYLEKKIDLLATTNWLKETNRKREVSERLLPAVLFIKAVAKALDTTPDLNAFWKEGLQLKNEINIGFAISLRAGGLLVPAIRNADIKSLEEIRLGLNDLIPRARALKLRSSELSDSTITITSLGENGADKVFGIIYPPQVALIGFGSILNEPVIHDGMLAIRPVVHVSLAGDHRATDGLTGSRFLEALNNSLQHPESL